MRADDKCLKIDFTLMLEDYFELALHEVTAKLESKFVAKRLKISGKQAKTFITALETLQQKDRREGKKIRGLCVFSTMRDLGVIEEGTYEALRGQLKGTVHEDHKNIRDIDHKFLNRIKWSIKDPLVKEEIRNIYRFLGSENPALDVTPKMERKAIRVQHAAWGVLSQEDIGQKYSSLDALFRTSGVPLVDREKAEKILKAADLKRRAIASLRRRPDVGMAPALR